MFFTVYRHELRAPLRACQHRLEFLNTVKVVINVSVLPPHGPLYKHDIAMNLQEEGMMEDRETEKVKRREGQYVYYFKSLALLSKCSCNHKNVVKLFFF